MGGVNTSKITLGVQTNYIQKRFIVTIYPNLLMLSLTDAGDGMSFSNSRESSPVIYIINTLHSTTANISAFLPHTNVRESEWERPKSDKRDVYIHNTCIYIYIYM